MKNNSFLMRITFNTTPCCIFSDENTAYEKLLSMRTVKDYGSTQLNSDGSVKHYLHTWDDGSRYLIQCPVCGAFFLVQNSEYHGSEDSYYSDWFQVNNAEHALLLNELYNGFQIEFNYKAPMAMRTNERFLIEMNGYT